MKEGLISSILSFIGTGKTSNADMTTPEPSTAIDTKEAETTESVSQLQGSSVEHGKDKLSVNVQPPCPCDQESNFATLSSEFDDKHADPNVTQNTVITKEMIVAEMVCHDEQAEEDSIYRKEAMAELDLTIREQRSARLHHLLEKSNFYAKFLLERMESQKVQQTEKKEKEKVKREKTEKRTMDVEGKENNALPGQQEDTKVSNETKNRRSTRTSKTIEMDGKTKQRRTRQKRKKEDLIHYNISDVVDTETLEKAAKQRKLNSSNVEKTNSEASDATCAVAGDNMECGKNPIYELQPRLVTGGALRSYQLEGVEWLKGLFENGINGILADEMGLGKTIQCISLLAYIIEQGVKGPFLVVGPLSTLPNWISEFKRFAPKINTLLYHGSKETRPNLRRKIMQLKGDEFKTAPVVVTSYEIVMADRQALQTYPWKFIIVDEGHRLKNLNCKLIRELKSIKSANRLLLTGTPLQNNLAELWSLLNFLLPDIFDDLNSFQAWFDFSEVKEEGGFERIVAKEEEKSVLQKLHAILTPFLLRRLKTDVDLSIPPKAEIMVYAPFTKKQEDFYREILDKTIYKSLEKKHGAVDIDDENSKAAVNTATGRPSRRSTQQVDFKWMFSAEADTDDIDTFIEGMNQAEERKMKKKEKENQMRKNALKKSAILNLTPKSILMMLRKCVNHTYLLEYPVNPDTSEIIIDENIVLSSGKMMLLDRMLPALKSRGHKVLIFSQMTKMLDIIQDYCWLRTFQCSRLDGSMSVEERQEQIEQFRNNEDTFVFLLSTRAGGLGINLAVADTVIIYDSDWNPQADLQAQDRAHRIGQTKPVVVYRFITANTIDQRMFETAKTKRKLEKMVIHKGRFKGSSAVKTMSPEELRRLLESSEHQSITTSTDAKHVINDEALEMLLDRERLINMGSEDSCNQLHRENVEKGQRLFELMNSTEAEIVL